MHTYGNSKDRELGSLQPLVTVAHLNVCGLLLNGTSEFFRLRPLLPELCPLRILPETDAEQRPRSYQIHVSTQAEIHSELPRSRLKLGLIPTTTTTTTGINSKPHCPQTVYNRGFYIMAATTKRAQTLTHGDSVIHVCGYMQP